MDVTDETFYEQVLQRSHEVPVVVDFWAEWCGPCRALGPVLEKEAAAREGQVVLAKVDVDANPAVAGHYEIRGIPAVKAFRAGKVVDEFVGIRSPQLVANFLDALSGPSALEGLLEEVRAAGDDPDLVEKLERGDHEGALEHLLEQARMGGEAVDLVRRRMVSLFDELGQEHPLSTRFRRQLATTLY